MPVDITITTDTIETDSSTLDAVDKALFNNIDKSVSDEIKGNLIALRAAAAYYISVVEDLNKEISEFENLLRHQQKLRRADRTNFGNMDEYIQGKDQIRAFLNSDIPRRLYKESFDFQ